MHVANLFNALLTRDTAPIEVREDAIFRVWDAGGPLTAFEAYDIAERFAMKFDVDAVCMHVGSAQPLEEEGRGYDWLVTFRMPIRKGIGRYYIVAERDAAGGVHIYETLMPADHADANDAGDPSVDRTVPVPFRDSCDVVASIGNESTQGAQIESFFNEQGSPAWRITLADESIVEQRLAA